MDMSMKVTFVSKISVNMQGRKVIPIPKEFHNEVEGLVNETRRIKITVESI
jgi:hypothetical protein